MPAIDQLYREPAMTVRIERTLYAIAFVAGMTMLLAIAQSFFDIRHVSIAYVIPVLVAAIRWGVTYGIVLTTARALGEFGAVTVVSGNISGETQTLPLYVSKQFETFNSVGAYSASLILAVLALGTLLSMNLLRRREDQDD